MKKVITLSVILLVLILFTTSIFAQPQKMKMRGKGMMKRSPTRILLVLKAKQKELKITDSQIEKVKSLMFSFEEKMIKMKSDNSLQQLELKKLLQDRENLNYENIKAALSKASNGRHDMFIERLKLREEINKILTPEQREAIKSLQKDHMKGRRAFQRRGRGLFQRGDRLQRFQGLRKRIKR